MGIAGRVNHSLFQIGVTKYVLNTELTSPKTLKNLASSELCLEVKGKVCIRANVAHQAGAYPGFRSMKRLGVFLLPPGWDVSPSQGYPPALNSPVPIYTPGWREAP